MFPNKERSLLEGIFTIIRETGRFSEGELKTIRSQFFKVKHEINKEARIKRSKKLNEKFNKIKGKVEVDIKDNIVLQHTWTGQQ